uniref:Family with sequence similarity 110 member C n=1 Tax=Astyanax mexicanus TaxID=7994 RepID=A0A8B9J8A9_ASTMX
MLDTSRILQKGPEYLRKQMEREREAPGRSAAERLAATKPEYIRNQQPPASETSEMSETGSSIPANNDEDVDESSPHEVNVVKRNSSKKRPDSLLLYRQKGELQRGATDGYGKKPNKRTLLLSRRDKTIPFSRQQLDEKPTTVVTTNREDVPRKPTTVVTNIPENISRKPTTVVTNIPEDRRRNRVSRSHSDISSRYSRSFAADFDTFFTYCGLDDDVVESVGRENFCTCSESVEEVFTGSGKVRSVSMAISDDGFSQTGSVHSDGLLEDELPDKKSGQGTSVIERNARIIKWLYSCRNAAQSGKTLRDLV